MKRPTIKDIAKHLGINVSTVSRALQNHPDISEQTKTRVKQIANLLNYSPNAIAVNLRNKKSNLIGLIVPSLSMFFTPSVIDGISAYLSDHGYRLLVLTSNDSLNSEIENIKVCCQSGVEGILISFTNQTKNILHLERAHEIEIPIVIFDKTIEQTDYSELLIDNTMAGYQCAEYLVVNKCKNILAILGNSNLSITKERQDGFLKKINDTPKIQHHIIHANTSAEARKKTRAFFEKTDTIDGVFAMSDELMIGAYMEVSNYNPTNHPKFITISNGLLPEYLNTPIVYLLHDGYELGFKAAKKIIEEINDTSQVHKKEFLKVKLKIPSYNY